MSKAFGIIGLSYGDEGKGATVDYLCRKHKISHVIRFNGGPQAAHNVVEPSGRWHCFSQFGSGTLVPGVMTHLNMNVLIEPTNLINELAVLHSKGIADALSRFSLDPRCRIITPWNKMIGQMQELSRCESRHGSVGMGVGNAAYDSLLGDDFILRVRDLQSVSGLKKKLKSIYEYKFAEAEDILKQNDLVVIRNTYNKFKEYSPGIIAESLSAFFFKTAQNVKPDEKIFQEIINSGSAIVFEGAQGVLLDPEVGFSPHVTKTPCNSGFLHQFIEPYNNHIEMETIGVVRAYAHRHGPGPLLTEDANLHSTLKTEHNQANFWQGRFRNGWFDVPIIKHALHHSPVDTIYMTCLDRLSLFEKIKICIEYKKGAGEGKTFPDRIKSDFANDINPGYVEFAGWKHHIDKYQNLKNFIDFISEKLNTNISTLADGPTYLNRYNL
jgi:adenylosuccinate synthase